MKKNTLKLKVKITNIRRVIMSFLFINLSTAKIFGTKPYISPDVTCYVAYEPVKTDPGLNVFIVIVPIAIIIILVVAGIKYFKFKKNENNISK